MAYLDVYYGRIGSYNGAIKIDESTISNITQFSSTGRGQYTSHNFIKPVGIFQHMGNNQYNVLVFAISTNYSADCIQWYQNYSGHSISYGRTVGGFNLATIQSQYIPNINYFNVIPWFNNIDDASKYSCGEKFNPSNWVGGLDVRVQYNWQSVPSISGKNGILNLAQIKAESINDGEPVSGASDSAFTGMSDDNNVATLVDVGELNNNKAKVVYNIPALTSGNYSYAKLVYKQGFIPTSKDDGTAVDLDLTDLGTNKTITVSNIVSGSVYWFVIFTDKSESDAVSLGENTEGVFFELDLTTDGRDVIRYNPAKEFLGAKQGELVGNNFTISDGVLDTSYDISWYYDPTENPKSIPADCTLTFEYDTFFPNGEGYLDWYIIDSDDTERIYWCFDTKHAFQANKWYNCKVVAKVENGKITRYKYVLDGAEVSCGTGDNILMPCTNTDTSKGISRIYFDITRQTKFKNMSIYYDFSEYHDGGGSGSGSSSGT